jgi:hypothetical protein
VQIVAAAGKTKVLAIGSDGLEGFRVGVRQRAAHGWVGLKQPDGTTEAGQ